MEIWSFKLGGRVDLINGLNHYVGFMELNPRSSGSFEYYLSSSVSSRWVGSPPP